MEVGGCVALCCIALCCVVLFKRTSCVVCRAGIILFLQDMALVLDGNYVVCIEL